MGHYAPQIAYNNPHIPFTFTRLGKAPEIKPASAEGEAPAAAKTETTADDSAVDAAEADETSTESEPKKGELAPSSLILSLSASGLDVFAWCELTGREWSDQNNRDEGRGR
jgi:hypothetical protein